MRLIGIAAALVLGAAVSGCHLAAPAVVTLIGEIAVKATDADTAAIENLCARGVIPPTMKSCQPPAQGKEP